MDWEFWTKELDEEVLVENSEFGPSGRLVRKLGFLFLFGKALNLDKMWRKAALVSCWTADSGYA